MKQLLATIALLALMVSPALAQRFAYVDTEYILEKIPEYTEAQKQLDTLAVIWQKDIDAKYEEVKKMYNKYQAEEFLLTTDMKAAREEEIVRKENEANALQRQKFGFEGDLFKKRQELIQPIQEKVYNAIQKIATNLGYDFILDKSAGGSLILFSNPKFDLSEQVLKSL